MIAADRDHLEAQVRIDALLIREKELNIFTDNFATLATQSSFLMSLGFSGLTMVPSWYRGRDSSTQIVSSQRLWIAELCFYFLLSTSIGLQMLTLCISTWSMIFGPHLALRGPEGSMSRAVDGMYLERKWALRFYGVGVIFLLLSGVSLGFLKLGINDITRSGSDDDDDLVNTSAENRYASYTTCSILFGFLIAISFYLRFQTRPQFKYPKNAHKRPESLLIRGGFDVENAGGGMPMQPDEYRDMVLTRLSAVERALQEKRLSPAEAAAQKQSVLDDFLARNAAASSPGDTSTASASPAVPAETAQALEQPAQRSRGSLTSRWRGSLRRSNLGSTSADEPGFAMATTPRTTPPPPSPPSLTGDSDLPTTTPNDVPIAWKTGARKEGPVIFQGKPALLAANADMITIFADETKRVTRKQLAISGNQLAFEFKPAKRNVFPATVVIGRTKLSIGFNTSVDRQNWVEFLQAL